MKSQFHLMLLFPFDQALLFLIVQSEPTFFPSVKLQYGIKICSLENSSFESLTFKIILCLPSYH